MVKHQNIDKHLYNPAVEKPLLNMTGNLRDLIILKQTKRPDMVAHACDPSTLGGRGGLIA